MASPELLAYIGFVIAVAARTGWAYYNAKRKAAEERGETLTFDWKYLLTGLVSIAAAVPTYDAVTSAITLTPETSALGAVAIGFVTAGGWNWFLNEFADKGA
jgi:hypothetical protein